MADEMHIVVVQGWRDEPPQNLGERPVLALPDWLRASGYSPAESQDSFEEELTACGLVLTKSPPIPAGKKVTLFLVE